MPNNFDLSNLALKAMCPNNEILYDDKGYPSIMVKIPKMTYAQLGLGTSNDVFPAFIVNSQEVNEIYISKYMNIVNNGRGYSLPGLDYANNMNFDAARGYCEAKGAGWHIMTAFEWGLLIAWCEHNGFIPLGNCAYGKYHTETNYKAIPMTYDTSTPPKILHTAGGTGPLEWYHDKTPNGIADLAGNGWEWTGGIRTVKGELQVLTNNNAADSAHSQGATSDEWKAIDAATGALITPDGEGTTTGSVKMDWVSSKLQYNTTITDASPGEHNCAFKDINCSANIDDTAKAVLIALGMHPVSNTLCTTYGKCYINNAQAERFFFRGGYYTSAGASSFPSFHGLNARSHAHTGGGFRAAYIKLPTA